MLRRVLACIALAIGAWYPAAAGAQHVDTARITAGRELVDAWGKKRALAADVERDIADEQSRHPQLAGDFWVPLVTALTPDTLGEFLVRIYARHLSVADMDSITVFLRSSAVRSYYYILASSSKEIEQGIDEGFSPPAKEPAPRPKVDTSTARAIQQLFQFMGMERSLQELMDSAMSARPEAAKGMPTEFVSEMMHQMFGVVVDSIVVPVYAQKLSEADLRAIHAFFESPAGRHCLTALPAIDRESAVARRTWRTAIRKAIAKEVQLRTGAKG